MWPQSLMPRSRLIADITRPPQNPIRLISSDRPKACSGVNGVIHHSAAPSALALSTPPTNPSTVFDGESFGAIRCLPSSLPQMYCSTSEDCTTITRKANNSTLRDGSCPGTCRFSSSGTCEMQNTQIISPHCTFAVRSR